MFEAKIESIREVARRTSGTTYYHFFMQVEKVAKEILQAYKDKRISGDVATLNLAALLQAYTGRDMPMITDLD